MIIVKIFGFILLVCFAIIFVKMKKDIETLKNEIMYLKLEQKEMKKNDSKTY